VKQTKKTNMQVGQHLVWYINSISTHMLWKHQILYQQNRNITKVISALWDKDQSGYWYNIFIAEVPSIAILHNLPGKRKNINTLQNALSPW